MNLVQKAINYLKALSAETITNAKSGHLGVLLQFCSHFSKIITTLMLPTPIF